MVSVVQSVGATGSGKTFTMLGDAQSSTMSGDASIQDTAGLVPRAAADLLTQIMLLNRERAQVGNTAISYEYKLQGSFYQLYKTQWSDLVSSSGASRLQLREDEGAGDCFLEGLSEHSIGTTEDLYRLIDIATRHRATSSEWQYFFSLHIYFAIPKCSLHLISSSIEIQFHCLLDLTFFATYFYFTSRCINFILFFYIWIHNILLATRRHQAQCYQ